MVRHENLRDVLGLRTEEISAQVLSDLVVVGKPTVVMRM